MSVVRRPATLFTAAAVVAVATGALLGVATHSDATAAPSAASAATAAAAAATGNPKVPGARPCCGYAFLRPGDALQSDQPARSTLISGGLGAGRLDTITTDGTYHLALGTDGNLVEYRTGADGARTAVWATGTRSSTVSRLVFQTDGNVVLRDTAGTALWSTGTAGRPAAFFDVYGNDQVVTQDATGKVLSAHGTAATPLPGFEIGSAISPGFVDSKSPVYDLRVQSDGNLVQYRRTAGRDVAVWSTRTAGTGPVRLTAQSDGNLVLRRVSTGLAVFTSNSRGPNAYYQLDMQDDGNIVLYRTDGVRRVQAVWASGIHR